MSLKAIGENVILRWQKQTRTGPIILPGMCTEKMQIAQVESIGPRVPANFLDLTVGDKVVIERTGDDINQDEAICIMDWRKLGGIIETA